MIIKTSQLPTMRYQKAKKSRICLAYQAVFGEKDTQLKRSKSVNRIMKRYKVSPKPIISKSGVVKIGGILRGLLAEAVSQLVLNAKGESPALSHSLLVEMAQRMALVSNATCMEVGDSDSTRLLRGGDKNSKYNETSAEAIAGPLTVSVTGKTILHLKLKSTKPSQAPLDRADLRPKTCILYMLPIIQTRLSIVFSRRTSVGLSKVGSTLLGNACYQSLRNPHGTT